MLIDQGKLIALLVEKTGQPKEEVQKQLESLRDRLRQVTQSGEAFTIDGFGTFTNEEGELHFEPAEQLQTEINQKYVGMKPIELMEPFKESGKGVPVEENGHTTAVPPEPAGGDDPAEPEQPAGQREEDETTDEPVDQPVPETGKEESEEMPPVTAGEEGAGQKSDEEAEIKGAPASAAESARPKRRSSLSYGKKSDSRAGAIIVGVLIIIALLLGGWLLYDSGVLFSDDASNNEYTPDTGDERISQTVPSPADSVRAAGAAADSTEQTTADSVSQSNQQPVRTEGGTYGLKGDASDDAENAYTIVIHSFRLRSTVQSIADSLNGQGYRTVLFDGTADGETRWRLGLGQFRSVQQAQQVVPQLTENYRENHFITRIQQ